jgi:asparagine synthase (glutamine-hydrolysing)
MCGISGIITRQAGAADKIIAAASTLQHRGPQYNRYWNEDSFVSFGHNRLCIIDTSEAAAQPLHYGDRYTIIHNGELYNYIELRDGLAKKGYSFTSASDTEVIVAAYAAWGKDCLQHCDGMFAFAIWDNEEKTLFAARDRFGEKPFYFYYDSEQFLFASEMKALWAAGVKKEVNYSLLYNFLTIGYTGNPADREETFYRNIHNLPPASFLFYNQSSHRLNLEQWDHFIPEEPVSISEKDAVNEFNRLFRASTMRRLRSDVPIGTSLSGGLDSSAIVATCAQLKSEQYTHHCFTAVFEGFEKSEEQQAYMVAKHFGLQHHLVRIPDKEIVPVMDKVMQHQESPIGSSSALAQYKVYEAAKAAGITVVLDGQGADEVLGGYHKYYSWYWTELFRQRSLGTSGELKAARKLGVTSPFTAAHKLAALVPDLAASMQQTRTSRKAARQPFLDKEFAFEQKRNLYYTTPATFDLAGALYFNTFVSGLEELLRLADRNSMAHAVEVRLPFLQHDLVKFLFSLPAHYKIHHGWTKWLLRKSMEEQLPGEVTWRKDKTGFETPQKQWMQGRDVQDRIMAAKNLLAEKGILSREAAKMPVQPGGTHDAGNYDWRFWSASYLFQP